MYLLFPLDCLTFWLLLTFLLQLGTSFSSRPLFILFLRALNRLFEHFRVILLRRRTFSRASPTIRINITVVCHDFIIFVFSIHIFAVTGLAHFWRDNGFPFLPLFWGMGVHGQIFDCLHCQPRKISTRTFCQLVHSAYTDEDGGLCESAPLILGKVSKEISNMLRAKYCLFDINCSCHFESTYLI